MKNRFVDAFQNGVFPSSKKVQEKQTKEEEKQTEEKTIPVWVLVNDYTFTKIKKEVHDFVIRGLEPKQIKSRLLTII